METRVVSKIGRFYCCSLPLWVLTIIIFHTYCSFCCRGWACPWRFGVGSGSLHHFFVGGGGVGTCWVLQVADLGPLPLLVGMGDPWISGLLGVGWL